MNFWEITRVPYKQTRRLSLFPTRHQQQVCPSFPGSSGGGDPSGGSCTQPPNLPPAFLQGPEHRRCLLHQHRTQEKVHFLLTSDTDVGMFLERLFCGRPCARRKSQARERGTASLLCGVHSWKWFLKSFTSSSQHSPHGNILLMINMQLGVYW